MEITKPGYDLRNTKYTVECSHCRSEFTFLEKEGRLFERIDFSGRFWLVLIDCPACKTGLRYDRQLPDPEKAKPDLRAKSVFLNWLKGIFS